jgi:predicted negative regulator of RcsB-dependent stress response
MAVYDLEEQEQISQLKAWWQDNGRFVVAVVLAAAIGSVGWQGYQWYRDKQANEASALFHLVEKAAEGGDAARAREAAGQLIDRFGSSGYAQMAALISANVQFDQGDRQNARAHLEWLASRGDDPALRDLARLRLAAVLLHEGAHAQALAQLEKAPMPALKPRFEDLRGDILAEEGKSEQARGAWQAALDALGSSPERAADPLHQVIRSKLESLES